MLYKKIGDLCGLLFYYLYINIDILMKNLNEYILESLLDDEDLLINDLDAKLIIKNFLDKNYKVTGGNFKIIEKPDNKYLVNSTGNVTLTNLDITNLTNEYFKFGEVNGYFNCARATKLISLKGSPIRVEDDFICSYCKNLKTLEGAPEFVENDFLCNSCVDLISLEGAPKKVGGEFCCDFNLSLKTLKGSPEKVEGDFNCCDCRSLETLEGAPKEVWGDFNCAGCKLTSLKGAPKCVDGDFNCENNKKLKTAIGAPKEVGGDFKCGGCGAGLTYQEIEKVSAVGGSIFTL